jgi:SAM-dependent methyltransferase
LSRFFRQGPVDTLDAGCGNGALSYAAYRLGNRVLGVTKLAEEVAKAQELFSFVGVDSDRLRLEVLNLYDLPQLRQQFDQIICFETLEHIADDRLIVRYFHHLLRDGGVLHLCCPFAQHPDHRGRFDPTEEAGWHVRDGYTLESYRALLEPAGFRIRRHAGVGTPLVLRLHKIIMGIFYRQGPLLAVPVFLLTWPLCFFDYLNPKVPYSLYVQAVKETSPEGSPSSSVPKG